MNEIKRSNNIIMILARKILRRIRIYRAAIIKRLKHRNFHVVSFKAWCEKNNIPLKMLASKISVTITPSLIFTANQKQYGFQEIQAELPDVYLATLSNVTVIEGSDIILANNKTALYDEMAYDPAGKYAPRMNKANLISDREINPTRVALTYKKNKNVLPVETAIHFCKDYSSNYFHWIIEALPRLSIIEKFREFDHVPLLVDGNLPSQHMEALQLLNSTDREIIKLNEGEAYKIKNVLYASCLSHMHNNYGHPVSYGTDVVISPDAIDYLRSKLLPIVGANKSHKKIYISRANLGNNKRLLNDEEISLHLAKQGFDIVFPETMTFMEQVKLFSQAEIIVGAAGSAIANIIFAPKECSVFVLNSNSKQINYSVFAMLGKYAGCNFFYIVGQDQSTNTFTETHNNYIVDVETIDAALGSVG